ncbi:hypothetical protein RN001_008621 [Aquatica leii]|uniref:Uncharacterized protein n=1 Tax=Aquatica leii TaxID=1421715 RepID=A0AAN7Q5A0_9COLE|nr:hypothetical protein RN001_008621 [Aquatica leii]
MDDGSMLHLLLGLEWKIVTSILFAYLVTESLITLQKNSIIDYKRNNVNNTMIAVYLVLTLISGSLSDKIDDSKNAKVLEYENEIKYPNYYFIYKTSNGITREEEGEITRSETGKETLVVRGFYSFIGPDNFLYFRQYIADDKGYREKSSVDKTILSTLSTKRINTPAIASLQGGGFG